MSKYASLKLSADLVDDARRDAPVFHRSLAAQVEHWARLGQAIETAPGFTLDRVRAALEGVFSPSDLEEDEQALFFDLLSQHTSASDDQAAFAASLMLEAGNVGYDEAGQLVVTMGDGSVETLSTR